MAISIIPQGWFGRRRSRKEPAWLKKSAEPSIKQQLQAKLASWQDNNQWLPSAKPSLMGRDTEKGYQQKLAVVTGTASAVLLGYTASSSFLWLAAPGLAYLYGHVLYRAYQQITTERRVGMAVADMAIATGMLSYGYLLLYTAFHGFLNGSLYMLAKTENHAQQRLVNILEDSFRYVWIKRGSVEQRLSFEDLQVGDVVVVQAGEVIPVDGQIVAGMAQIDQQMLTGEARPVDREPGDEVFAATLILSGRLEIEVSQTGADTMARQIEQTLDKMSNYQNLVQAKIDKLCDRSAMALLGLGAVSFPWLGGLGTLGLLEANFALNLRFIDPLNMLNYLNLASDEGILVKDGRALELLTNIDTVIFDKTGTLTQEQPTVSHIHVTAGFTEDHVLSYAATAEAHQSHPIAAAIRQAADDRSLLRPNFEEMAYEVGYGLRVKIDGQRVLVGSPRFMSLNKVKLSKDYATLQEQCNQQGELLVYVAIDEQIAGAIQLTPTIRPEAQALIASLKARGITTYIVSGDQENITQRLAQQLDVDHYLAETLPQQKANFVTCLQEIGHKICFIGDGINDSLALKQANVSISLNGAAPLAIETAQIVLLKSNLYHVERLFTLAHSLDRSMRRNLWFTIIPSAAIVFGVYGFSFGFITSYALNYSGLCIGTANAMLPVLNGPEPSSSNPT